MVTRKEVARFSALADRETVKFAFEEGGSKKEGFVVRRGDRIFAYRNECRHIPMTLDWVENRFLSRDKCFLQCATHGARYEIETGLCIDGPPAGERLRALAAEVVDDKILVTLPG